MSDMSAKQGEVRRIRLAIVDRQPIVLQGLRSILGAQQDFDVVASCCDGTSGLQAIRNFMPDAALLADTLPDLTASEILAIAKAENLCTRLVFFTESDSESGRDLTAALAAGACSAISKCASADTMLRQLRSTTKRGVSPRQFDLSPTGKDAGNGGRIEKTLELLTHRERQIARLVSEGKSNKEIGRQLNLSAGTVKVHLYNIFQKLEITNRTVLATLALLQRPSGFGTLALAFLACAIADELRASETNDIVPGDNGIGQAGEHAEYEPWKKAILRHLIAWESGETSAFSQRDFSAEPSQVANLTLAEEALRAAEPVPGLKPWKDHGPAGSSTLSLPAPLLRGSRDAQVGDPSPGPDIQRPTSQALMLGGSGTFAAVAGALIYTLNDSVHAAQPHHADHALIDSFVVATGENATTNLAGFTSHDFRPSSAVLTTENESVAEEGARSQVGHGAEGDTVEKPVGVAGVGHDASIGGYSRDHAAGSSVGGNVVYRSPVDSNSVSSHSAFNFASGSSRINLAAFGTLACLHMTAASKSIPPHTLAWIYNSASNETIVYVNPTDRALDIGDGALLEVHLEGIVSIAESDVVAQRESAAVAVTLEQLQEILPSATALDEIVLTTDNDHPSIGASGSILETVGVSTVLADDGLRLQFGQARTGSGQAAEFSTNDSADAGEESDDASGVSAHASSIQPAYGAAVANPTLTNQPINAGIGISSTRPDDVTDPTVATAAGTGRGNAQHSSEPESAKAPATERTEADVKPGNGVGKGGELHTSASGDAQGPAKTAEPGAAHGKSGQSSSAPAPEATERVEASVATAAGADRGHAQHGSEPESAKAAATEPTEAGVKSGNDAKLHTSASGDAQGPAKTAEPGVAHGKSGQSSSAPAPEAIERVEASVATAAGADHGHARHGSEPESAKAAATEPTEAGVKSGNGVGKGGELHTSDPGDAQGPAKTAEPGAAHGKSGQSSSAPAPEAIERVEASVATAAGADHGHARHGSEPESAKAAAMEPTEAGVKPGNVGNGAELHAPASDDAQGPAKTAEPSGAEHGKSENSNSAHAPETAESVETSVAAAAGTARGNSQPESAKAATEPAEAGVIPGHGAEHYASASDASRGSAETAGSNDVEHGHQAHSGIANAPAATDIVEPRVATGGDGGGDNTQHASEPVAATTEAGFIPGNGAEQPASASEAASASAAANTAEQAVVEHSNSGHDLHSISVAAPEAAEIVEPDVAAGGGSSQHASESASAKPAAPGSTEAGSIPVNNDNEQHTPELDVATEVKTLEPTVPEHGNAMQDADSISPVAPEAGEILEPSVVTGGNAQQPLQSAVTASSAAPPAQAASETSGADQEPVFRFDSKTAPFSPVAAVDLKGLDNPVDPSGLLNQHDGIEMIVSIVPSGLDEQAANHGNGGSHHAIVPAHHDLLI